MAAPATYAKPLLTLKRFKSIMQWFLLTVAVGWLTLVFVRRRIARDNERYEESLRQEFRDRVALDPLNVGAYEMLGDSLWRAGRFEEARQTYEQAVTVATVSTPTEQTKYRLRLLEQDRLEREGLAPPTRRDVICPRCGAINPSTYLRCENCEGTLLVDSFWVAMRQPENIRAGLEMAAMLGVIAICLALVAALPGEVKGCVMISSTAVCIWRFMQAIEGRRG